MSTHAPLPRDDGEIRDGEVAVDLPATFDGGLYFIGRVRTPWATRADCPKNVRERDAPCTLEVDPHWAPALKEVATCSHLLVLYWMHLARRDLVLQSPRHYGGQVGCFAVRTPVRPNPIAASVVRLFGVEENRLRVSTLDCVDGTPLLDIKPYFASVDSVPDATVGWRRK
jgi:tRNA-Thr(GGU) m(6)t(6)A37 methyltransferase TsaA